MFESFYGLTANPFRMSADEQFRYAHRTYVKAWSYLKYALERGEGFVLITGRPGTGKTTLIRDTLSELDSERIQAVNLASNQLQGEELLRLVALELGYEAQEFNKATLLTRIEQHALGLHDQGRRVVVIVDEAQNLSPNGLEELRLLSNLQTGNQPLFQIVLVGQEELRSVIYGREMENITQRIVASCRLDPIQEQQVQSYIEHRLDRAGWEGDPGFDPAVFQLLHRISHGVPREINLVMARLMLYGSLEKKHHFTLGDLLVVLRELVDEQRLAFDQTLIVEELHSMARAGAAAVESEASAANESHTESEVPELTISDIVAETSEDELEDRRQEEAEAVTDSGEPEPEAREGEMPTESSVAWAQTEPALGDENESVAPREPIGEEVLLTGEDEVIDELPSLPVTPEDDTERRPHGLLTDVGELLDDGDDSSEGGGRVWRWFFYPVAIAVLLVALLIAKPHDLTLLWNDVLRWVDVRFGPAQVSESSKTQPSPEPPQAKPDKDSQADTVTVSERKVQNDEGRMERPQPAPSAAGADTTQTESDTDDHEPSVDLDRNPWLSIDEASGDPADESHARYRALIGKLKADTRLVVVLTGVYTGGTDPMTEMRHALELADRLSNLLVRDGIERQRIVVEGKAAGETDPQNAVHVSLKPMVRTDIHD